MWFLQIYLAALIYTIVPLLVSIWILATQSGGQFVKLLFAITILSPIIAILTASLKVFIYLGTFYFYWVAGTLVGAIVWALFAVFVESALYVLRYFIPGFKFSLLNLVGITDKTFK